MGQKLGIRTVAARTPQAKGQVERNQRTRQDRLIKKLRRRGDRLLRSRQGLSGKRISAGAQPTVCGSSSSAGGLSRSQPTARELREIFRLETERGIGNDWVIRHEGGNLQLTPGSRRYGPTPSKTLVSEWEDGTMEVYYRGEVIAFTELKKQPQKTSAPLPPRARPVMVRKAKQDHPWRQAYKSMRPPNRAIAAPSLVGIPAYASP
ncbi:MAG TPA: hypothetical protein VMQ17_14275 [Candidatus Sulfotelmatobacter sp.]|nr:hypothetical protein [Candidatus Sulfotelmatobacter sp.]